MLFLAFAQQPPAFPPVTSKRRGRAQRVIFVAQDQTSSAVLSARSLSARRTGLASRSGRRAARIPPGDLRGQIRHRKSRLSNPFCRRIFHLKLAVFPEPHGRSFRPYGRIGAPSDRIAEVPRIILKRRAISHGGSKPCLPGCLVIFSAGHTGFQRLQSVAMAARYCPFGKGQNHAMPPFKSRKTPPSGVEPPARVHVELQTKTIIVLLAF